MNDFDPTGLGPCDTRVASRSGRLAVPSNGWARKHLLVTLGY